MSVREVFALDIGTRKIAGLIMARTEEGFAIKQASLHQQLPDAMADGQIHHIDAVAKIIAKIKKELEEKSGAVLRKTAVAAAGRSLITQTGLAETTLTPNQRISSADIQELELKAVWTAIKKLATNRERGVMNTYLCVGYSTIQYFLDGEPIGSLLGHQGGKAEVKVIATFLPRIVIDSLGTAIEKAGLEMSSLTLEPIAAMHIVVPATMRMLNIALVDIGAGTSDLALAAAGTIKNYGMVSYAGDAITKGIAEHFLLDLPVAERVKINLKPETETECQDVFGNKLTLNYNEVLTVIDPHAQQLAEKVAKEIVRLNGEAPKGIILIGGGSLTPQLASLLAENLELPENLVRVRGRAGLEAIEGVPDFEGPEVITPIGIGCTYLDGLAMDLIQVKVNGRSVQLFKGATSTIGDALLNCGFSSADLVARPGPAFTVEINGRCITIPGTLGNPAAILKNGSPADLSTHLKAGDEIKVTAVIPGKKPQVTLGEFTEAKTHSFELTLNGSPLKVRPQILVNNKQRPKNYIIKDRDKITYEPISTFAELFRHLQIPLENEVSFYLNGEKAVALEKIELFLDGKKQPLNTPLRSGLKGEYKRRQCTVREICRPKQKGQAITVTINGENHELKPKQSAPLVNGQIASYDHLVRPNDRVEYSAQTWALNTYIVTDIFRDYQPNEAFFKKGGRILVNGKEAGFTTPIKHGDTIELAPKDS